MLLSRQILGRVDLLPVQLLVLQRVQVDVVDRASLRGVFFSSCQIQTTPCATGNMLQQQQKPSPPTPICTYTNAVVGRVQLPKVDADAAAAVPAEHLVLGLGIELFETNTANSQ